MAGNIDDEVKTIIDRAYARCEALLNANLQKVTEIADYLVEHETIDRETFEEAMRTENV